MAKCTPAFALVVWMASLGALHAQDMAKPLGKWERKIGKSHVTLIVEENRLHVTIIGEDACTVHADYRMTKDGIVYGVVTSIETDEEEVDKSVFDALFTCRYRIDEGALIIRDLKCREVTGKDELWNGRFKAVGSAPSRSAAAAPASSRSQAIYGPSGVSTGTSATKWDRSCAERALSGGAREPEKAPSNSSNNPPQLFNFWIGYMR